MTARIAILISGRGSNMRALLQACQNPDFPAEVALVLSNKAGAGGLEIARDMGAPTAVLGHADYPDRAAFENALDTRLKQEKIDFICLAGFMRLLGEDFVKEWRDQILNVHPSLLPAFRGLNTHERAIDAGVRIHGCTVHFVREDMDDGPIVGQAAVPVFEEDEPADLAERVLAAEHLLYPECVRLVAEGRASVRRERVVLELENGKPGAGPLFYPAPHKPQTGD
ncbi:MAG: phosphoribosylglycinamide formyltransferase [Euryhalocaulis sp.]|uniref:phosphoribosylglycinamide formyltransferase n=1 Tax=Euryhalocaulis sp. TaxID=2744307 RepID=UPI0017CF63A5|nr:phosphoribosylglycinamide formyltransferase [Euryhalocaulis sp.]MBA4800243.1 phosphoribosylglycinamide formyltransferase [Euryhalocaulis sp.]